MLTLARYDEARQKVKNDLMSEVFAHVPHPQLHVTPPRPPPTACVSTPPVTTRCCSVLCTSTHKIPGLGLGGCGWGQARRCHRSVQWVLVIEIPINRAKMSKANFRKVACLTGSSDTKSLTASPLPNAPAGHLRVVPTLRPATLRLSLGDPDSVDLWMGCVPTSVSRAGSLRRSRRSIHREMDEKRTATDRDGGRCWCSESEVYCRCKRRVKT